MKFVWKYFLNNFNLGTFKYILYKLENKNEQIFCFSILLYLYYLDVISNYYDNNKTTKEDFQ